MIFKYHDIESNGYKDGADYGLDYWHFSVTGMGYSWEGDTSGGGLHRPHGSQPRQLHCGGISQALLEEH